MLLLVGARQVFLNAKWTYLTCCQSSFHHLFT